MFERLMVGKSLKKLSKCIYLIPRSLTKSGHSDNTSLVGENE